MFVLSIASKIAFGYKEYVTDPPKSGSICQVMKQIWIEFGNDFRLIKPKKFGFHSTHSQKEKELALLNPQVLSEFSVTIDIAKENPNYTILPEYY